MLKHKKFELLCRSFRAKNFLIWHVDNKLSCIQLRKFIDVWKTFLLQLLIWDRKIFHIKNWSFCIYYVKFPCNILKPSKHLLKLIKISNSWKSNCFTFDESRSRKQYLYFLICVFTSSSRNITAIYFIAFTWFYGHIYC